MSNIFNWIGGIGGFMGLVSMLVTGVFWLRNRRPRLCFFAPRNFYGTDTGCGQRVCHLLLWFTNHSKMPANLFLDTMSVSIRRNGQENFVRVQRFRPPREKPGTDFPEYEQQMLGVNKVSYFNEFEKMPVTIEEPLLGYICFPFDDSDRDHPLSDIRIEICDQFFTKHSLQVNLEKQQQTLDPYSTSPSRNES